MGEIIFLSSSQADIAFKQLFIRIVIGVSSFSQRLKAFGCVGAPLLYANLSLNIATTDITYLNTALIYAQLLRLKSFALHFRKYRKPLAKKKPISSSNPKHIIHLPLVKSCHRGLNATIPTKSTYKKLYPSERPNSPGRLLATD